ncbi:MAG: (d)CMP kinase [Acidimicrobiia bacterium]
MTEERLQKAIARTGLASRRKAEDLIKNGRVTVNGVMAKLGTRIDPQRDLVEVDGVSLPVRPDLVYYLLNKPSGVVSSVSDPEGRPVVTDLVPGAVRVWPVGRLDQETEGLLILTNDGDLTHVVSHPRFGVTKRYRVLVEGQVSAPILQRFIEGVELDDGPAKAIEARSVDKHADRTLLELVMGEGRKREVRRMCEALGLEVVYLFRAAIGPVTDTRLQAGEWRELSATEVRAFYEAASDPVHTEGVEPETVTWVIAIDGPAGAGKTTVSMKVAEVLGLAHLDTGAYYRAATLAVLRAGTSPASPDALSVISGVDLDFSDGKTIVNGEDVTSSIRGADVTAAVSAVSAIPEVREVMVDRQRAWVVERGGRAVVEGRDIGTVVFPMARLKVFLTATEAVRAQRRSREHPELTGGGVAADLRRRDREDSTRAMSPLSAAPDAVTLDTSEMSFEEVVAEVHRLADERGF